jgi:hypothetical protein
MVQVLFNRILNDFLAKKQGNRELSTPQLTSTHSHDAPSIPKNHLEEPGNERNKHGTFRGQNAHGLTWSSVNAKARSYKRESDMIGGAQRTSPSVPTYLRCGTKKIEFRCLRKYRTASPSLSYIHFSVGIRGCDHVVRLL